MANNAGDNLGVLHCNGDGTVQPLVNENSASYLKVADSSRTMSIDQRYADACSQG